MWNPDRAHTWPVYPRFRLQRHAGLPRIYDRGLFHFGGLSHRFRGLSAVAPAGVGWGAGRRRGCSANHSLSSLLLQCRLLVQLERLSNIVRMRTPLYSALPHLTRSDLLVATNRDGTHNLRLLTGRTCYRYVIVLYSARPKRAHFTSARSFV